jgi:hypothetical protein
MYKFNQIQLVKIASYLSLIALPVHAQNTPPQLSESLHSFDNDNQWITPFDQETPLNHQLTPLATDVIYSETQNNRTFSLYNNSQFVSLKIPQAEMNAWNTDTLGFNDNTQRLALSKAIYGFVKDDFDFIFFINNNATKPAGISYYGQLMSVSSSVKGISKYSNYNYTQSYGSSGKLQSVMHLPYLNAIQQGPTLHEIMHTWANFFKDFEIANPNGNYPSIPHWGWTGIPGQLGGFDPKTLVDLGNNNWQANNGKPGSTFFGENANGGNSLPYANWELYLMGMAPADSLYDIPYFTNVVTDANLYGIGKFSGTKNIYTKQQFLTDRGPRIPAFGQAQTKFKCLFVVLTSTDLTTQEWTNAASQISWLTYPGADQSSLYNFYEATKGVGQLDPSLNSSLKNSVTSLKSFSKMPSAQIQKNGFSQSLGQVHWSLLKSSGEVLESGTTLNQTQWKNPLKSGMYLLQLRSEFQSEIVPFVVE